MRSGRSKLYAKLTSSFLRKWWFVIFVSLVFVLLGAIIFIFFSQWVNLYINSELVLRNESMTFGWWRKPPVKPLMKVYVYNVTNADGFLNNGEKPVLNELGPYVYVQSWEKVNLAFNKNHTISFNQHKEFVFDRNQSVGDEDDLVVVPNIPMLSATSQSKHAARFLRLAMASIMDILKVKPFVEVSVHQLLWGYEDPLLKLAKDVVPKEQKLPYEEFGLMYGLQKLSEALGITNVTELLDALNLEDVLEFALAGLDAIFNRPDKSSQPHHVIRVPSRSGYNRQNGPGCFGFFKVKNGTSRDKVTVFTGGSNIEQYGVIDRFNGNKSLLHWKTEQCNRLNGSDGSIFPPHITKNTTLFVYDKDLCRLLPLSYQKEVETANGVAGFRFTPPKDVFADVSTKPENECFCPGGPPCAPNGFFNVSLCQYDSPILLSFPHFYLADEKYRLAVEGVSPPVADKHEFFLDVQPNYKLISECGAVIVANDMPFLQQMGVSLRARARVQINLAVSQVVDIKQVATFPDIVFPIMWFEDGIDALPAEVTDMLNFATRVPPVAKACLSYGLFVVGGLLLLLAVICLVRNSGRQETLHLEGTSHYVKPDKTASGNGHSNGKSKTLETLNPSFLNGPDNPNTN